MDLNIWPTAQMNNAMQLPVVAKDGSAILH